MKFIVNLCVILFGVLMHSNIATAETPREQLKQMVAALQSSPADNLLREKIVRMALMVKPAPTIPEAAMRAFVKGGVFQKEAKDADGYALAISAYGDALLMAPWWADAYFNLGVALTSVNKFDQAIAATKIYMASLPTGSSEARDAQNRIYELEAKAEMVSAQLAANMAAKAADTPAAREAALLKRLEGARFATHQNWPDFSSSDIYEIKAGVLVNTYSLHSWTGPMTRYGYRQPGDYIIARMPYRNGTFTWSDNNFTYTYKVSPDGQVLLYDGFITNQPNGVHSLQDIPRQ